MEISNSEYVGNDEKLSFESSLNINDITDSFELSYKNMISSKKLNITAPLSYMNFDKEMEDYKKNYDKFIRIANEYIHNIEQRKKESAK